MRADGWARLPLIRMTNVSLLPGEQTLDEVFDGATTRIYMETNKSWSIDDKRYNFQFGCEIAWEIRNGKRVRMLKNPSYSGITTEFWNSCAAIAGPRALDAVGRSELRQGPARAGDGHGPRRQPVALPQHQDRERLCRIDRLPRCQAIFDQVADAARALGRARTSKRSSPPACSALTRFANNAIHQNVAERSALSFRARR